MNDYPFTSESSGDDEGYVDGVTAHDNSVETFEEASLASTCRVLHPPETET